jgi:thioredoxin-dependent peroxiredoxin
MVKWVLVALVVGVSLSVWRSATKANDATPKVGNIAPIFTLPDQAGKARSIEDFRGKWLILYFYPKDDTPGCTEEACTFRDDLYKLTTLGAEVVGISVDDTLSHAAFAKKYRLPFPLLSDESGEVAARYGSLRNFGFLKIAKRNTFVIDPQGKVERVYLSVSTSKNSQEVIEDLKKLSGK